MVSYYTDRDTGRSYAHSEDVTDSTFAEFLADEQDRGRDVVAGIAAAPDDDTRPVSRAVSASVSPNLTTQEIMAQTQREQEDANRRWEAERQQQEALRQKVQQDQARMAKQVSDAAIESKKREQAGALQGAIDNAVRRPTTAIYAQYLAGHMPESQVLAAIEEQIAARLEGMGIDTGTQTDPGGPTVAGTQPGAGETGSALVKRMAQAELEQLQSRFAGFIPQQNTAGGETKPAYDTRLAAYQAATAANPSAIAPLPGAIAPAPIRPAVDTGLVDTTVARTVTPALGTGVDTATGDWAANIQAQGNQYLEDNPLYQLDLGFMGGEGGPVRTNTIEDLNAIIRREREATQEGRNLELLDYLNRTFNFGDLSPIVQRPLSRAVGSGADLTSQYLTQLFGQGSPTGQVPTQTFASFLQGGLPTAGSLQTNLRNIFGQLGQGGDTNFLRTLQGTFQDPKDVFGAALQPGLKRVAPAVRGAFESQAGQQFQNVLAADPMRFKTPQESFRFFGNKGYF